MLRPAALVIDPLNTKDSTQSDLLSMVLDQNRINVFHKEKIYFIEYEDPAKIGELQKISVSLTNDIVCLEKQTVSGITKERYCVISNKPEDVIGHGSFGTKVVRVAATLKQHRDGSIEAKANKHRIVKIQEHSPQHTLEDALREAEMLKVTPDAHGKNMVVEYDGKGKVTSYLVDEEFSGVELYKVYEDEFSGKAPLTMAMRFKITSNMLRAAYKFHQRGLAHRDIKPENFLINPVTCEIRLIDPGLATYIDANDKRYVGTLMYSAPEAFSQKYFLTDKSDMYSIGLLLLPIWRGAWRFIDFDTDKKAMREAGKGYEKISMPEWNNFLSLSIEAATAMSNALRLMLALRPRDRIPERKAIESFEYGYLQYKLKTKYAKLTENEKADITVAHNVALDLFFKLIDIENSKSDQQPLQELKEVLDSAVNKLADSPNVINEFIETVQVKSFVGIKTKEELTKKIAQVVSDFENVIDILIEIFDRIDLDIAEFDKLTPDSEMSLTRRQLAQLFIAAHDLTDKTLKEKRRVTIDQLANLTNSIRVELAQLIPAVENMEKNVCKAFVPSYGDLVTTLRSDQPVAASALSEMKKKLKQAVVDYVADTLTPAIVEPASRNDAITHSEELNKYVNSIDTANDIAALQQATLMQPDKQKLLSFTMFGKATLRTRVQAALDECKQVQPS